MNSSSTFFSTCLLLVVMIHALLLQSATAQITTTTPPSPSPTNAPPPLPFGQNIKTYTLLAPVCSTTAEDNVKCDFTGIAPATGNLAFSVTAYTDCTGAAEVGVSLSTGATTATAVDGAHSVTIDIATTTDLTVESSEEFKFCLLTSLKDDNGQEMFYQGQKISATFNTDGNFAFGSIDSVQFDGISGVADNIDKTFGVSAKRCDIDRNEITSPALAIGTTLFICLDSTDANTVIQTVETLVVSKTGVTPSNVLNANTELQGEGTIAVTIGTRPYVEFFEDTTTNLEISGTVTLADGVGRRHLARILQSELLEEFELQVELEAVEDIESSANSAAFGTAAIALLGATIVAIM